MASIGEASVTLSARTENFVRGMRDAEKRIGAFSGKLNTTQGAVAGLSRSFGAGGFAGSIIYANQQMEKVIGSVTGFIAKTAAVGATITLFYKLGEAIGTAIVGVDKLKEAYADAAKFADAFYARAFPQNDLQQSATALFQLQQKLTDLRAAQDEAFHGGINGGMNPWAWAEYNYQGIAAQIRETEDSIERLTAAQARMRQLNADHAATRESERRRDNGLGARLRAGISDLTRRSPLEGVFSGGNAIREEERIRNEGLRKRIEMEREAQESRQADMDRWIRENQRSFDPLVTSVNRIQGQIAQLLLKRDR